MAWFDGTFDYSIDELEKEFPAAVTPDLRLSENGERIAIINGFQRGTVEYELSDPKVDEARSDYVFFHVFFGEDAAIAERTVGAFLTNADNDGSDSVVLFRKEADRLFMYSYGLICSDAPAAPEDPRFESNEVYYLPLKRYLFKCPVCGHRTLPYQGYYMICGECGWEDEGVDDDDGEPSEANGDCTIRQYREKYLKIKEDDPDYSQSVGVQDE